MTAQDRGWGPPGCIAAQLVRITVPGMLDSAPYFPLRVRREVAPLFLELARWLVAERRRLGLPALSSSGGYNKRKIAGTQSWSNHSWGLAGDFNAAANPHRRPLRTDMPPGTREKAESLGLYWGAGYSKPDPMHFELLGTPADARRRVAALTITTGPAPTHPRPAPAIEEDIVTPADIEAVAQRVAVLLGQEPHRMNFGNRLDEIRQVVRGTAEDSEEDLPDDRPPLIDMIDEIRKAVRPGAKT